MILDSFPESPQENVLLIRDEASISDYLAGTLRFREHSEAMGFRAGDVLVIENALGENESFRVTQNARAEDGVNTDHRGFSQKELDTFLRAGKIKAVELNMTPTAVADVLGSSESRERDNLRIPQHLESLQGDDLKNYASYYAREQAALEQRRGEQGLNPIDKILIHMQAPAGNPHTNTLQRGPVAGDMFQTMGKLWVIVEANYNTGKIRYREIGEGRNVNNDQEDGFEELKSGVRRGAVEAVTLNQATNFAEVIEWMDQLPPNTWRSARIKKDQMFDHIVRTGLVGLDPQELSSEALQEHFLFENYVPIAPVLCQVLRSHWEKISRFDSTPGLSKKLVLSFPGGGKEAYRLDENNRFVLEIPNAELNPAKALTPQELFEKSLTVQSIQTQF